MVGFGIVVSIRQFNIDLRRGIQKYFQQRIEWKIPWLILIPCLHVLLYLNK